MPRPQRNRPFLHRFDLKTGERARKGITGAAYADIEDGSGRYESRCESTNSTAVFIDSNGTETILPKEGSQDLAQNVPGHAAYRAHVSVTAAQLLATIAALRQAGTHPRDRIEHAAVAPSDCTFDTCNVRRHGQHQR